MEYTIFVVLLFPGFCVLSTPPKKGYYLVSELRNWDDAHANCISKYTDLAQIQHSLNFTFPSGYTGKAWIGLFKELSDWTWVDGKRLGFSKWKEHQQNNKKKDDEICACINEYGDWQGDSCFVKKKHICFDGQTYTLADDKMTWNDSKALCESAGSTLVVISNKTMNDEVKSLLSGDACAWIGLSKVARWYWSENDELLTYQNWKTGQPDDTEVDSCATVRLSDGTWSDELCEKTFPSICYGEKTDDKTLKTMIRVKIRSSANLEKQAVASELQQQLQASLAQQGLGGLKLTWSQMPVKTQEQQQQEETCPTEPEFT